MNTGIWVEMVGLFCAGFCLFEMGKLRAKNTNVQKEKRQQQKKLELAAMPALSWDELVEWMRNGGNPVSSIS